MRIKLIVINLILATINSILIVNADTRSPKQLMKAEQFFGEWEVYKSEGFSASDYSGDKLKEMEAKHKNMMQKKIIVGTKVFDKCLYPAFKFTDYDKVNTRSTVFFLPDDLPEKRKGGPLFLDATCRSGYPTSFEITKNNELVEWDDMVWYFYRRVMPVGKNRK